MKIAIASTWRVKCGISTYSSYLVEELAKNNEVKVFCEDRNIGGPDDTQKVNVPYLECWQREGKYDGMIKPIKEFNPDVIHIQNEFGFFGYTRTMSILLHETVSKIDIPKVVTYHSIPLYPNDFFTWYFNKFDPIYKKKIFHSETALKHVQDKFNVTGGVHINHGVKLCPLLDKIECRKELGIPENSTVLMSMGYFGGLKGVMELIELFSKFKDKESNNHPRDAKFIYVGGLHPPTAKYGKKYMLDCMKRIIDLGLKDDFKITGYLPESDLHKYYAAADLFLLNYKNSGYISASGCSAKLVASKRPIITTSGTYRNEELIDGETCIKVKVDDMDGMLVAAEQILLDKTLYNKIVDEAYKYAIDNSWENISKKHVEVYEEIIK